MRHLRLLLLPFSLVYGIIVWLRNLFYDCGWLKQTVFDVPVIVVGNLAVGGTGKSPMVEYLIRMLVNDYQVATLSRGYGRTSRGYREVYVEDTAELTGDEPLQFKRKFPEITVAVCEDRVEGVRKLVGLGHEVILLDDAYQHRALRPGLSLLLFDYHSVLRYRWLLPAGNYRDWFAARKRADILVVTKTPAGTTARARRVVRQRLAFNQEVPVLFGGINYGELTPLLSNASSAAVLSKRTSVLLVTGIANPRPLYDYLAPQVNELIHLSYGDHHPYTSDDVAHIKYRFDAIPNNKKLIVTTEKDSQRLLSGPYPEMLDGLPIYIVPIQMTFADEDARLVCDRVLAYVRSGR